MARPLRFRHSPEAWSEGRVERQLLSSLQDNIGAEAVSPRFEAGGGWTTHRFEMDNGDVALFARRDDEAYWMGNTETPKALWRTEKYGWREVPYHVARWAQRELLATLHEEDPWLADYPHLSWFFLPVFMSKDGRDSTRAFFRDHAGGFPDVDRETALQFFEDLLHRGTLDPYRHTMSGKLGTSETVDRVRMSAAMAEFVAADLLTTAGYDVTPEIEVTTGHSLDFRAEDDATNVLVEVTRPQPPATRAANGPVAAIRDTAQTKTDGQLAAHGGGAVLFVDCSSFPDDAWRAVRDERPDVRHRPAVVYRVRPMSREADPKEASDRESGERRRPASRIEGYRKGSVPLDLDVAIEYVD
ncbi:DUF5784 family protein [Halovivax limisalsi]|uniref:DUF5784 family protein n=1 Tax=Halovivax limisalsi TaxID=1453760 RepID=UPI001FFCA397|nr:DUF5784 family protein [Halovivax limisalsi]